jgi:hypothetical protein
MPGDSAPDGPIAAEEILAWIERMEEVGLVRRTWDPKTQDYLVEATHELRKTWALLEEIRANAGAAEE